jgi:signal peptidase I
MEPLMMTGDVVSARTVSTDEVRSGVIKPGMVVLADNPMDPGHLFTHRVIQVNPDKTMVTKGDANLSPDPIHLSPEKVRGVEMLRIPYIGLPALKMREGDIASLAAMAFSVAFASLIVQRSFVRSRREDDENSENSSTRVEVKATSKSDKHGFKSSYALAASIIAVILVSTMTGSDAAFTGWTGQSNNAWRAAAVFPAPGPAAVVCGGASYQPSANTTLTCAPGTISGTTTSYTLTIAGTGALTQWSVTADWSKVPNWLSSKAWGTGVTDTGEIKTATGYQIKGSANGSTNPADTWNHAWISSTKAAEVFTINVTTK